MRHPYILKSALLATLTLATANAQAKSDISLLKIRAVNPASQVNMLDSVISDSYRKIYKYNEYGYITSVMTYRKDSQWTVDTSYSYVQDYVFNDAGQCTSRIRYNVDEQGNRSTVEDKGELVVKDGLTWEYTYERFNDGNLHPATAKGYDKWGNLSVEITYETDWYTYEDYIYSYIEKRYNGSIHPGHYKQYRFENAYRTYYVEAKSGERTMDPQKLNLSYGNIQKWEMQDGKLYYRVYHTYYLDSDATVADMDKYLTLEREDAYELNADGTRPERMYSTYQPNTDYESCNYYEYTWDDKGRLLSESCRSTANSDVAWKHTYTYADDYAKELSLMDAVYALQYELMEYPEDEYCQFGHIATHVSENSGSSYKGTDNTSYTWDGNGHLVSSKWAETGYEWWNDYGSDEPTTKEYSDTGEEYFFYNSDGHMAYMTGKELDEDDCEYYKREFVYEKGIWTDEEDYSGESLDGPWTQDDGGKKVRARRSARKSAAFIEDMTDGYHDISYDDGVFFTQGSYYVSEGKITFGYYQQYISNNVALPKNPELNYTEPEVPLDVTDWDSASAMMARWSYEWDAAAEEWKLQYGPEVASHIYQNGNEIICDSYNREQTKTGTTTYTLDDAGRLVKQSGSDCEITYEYLADDSNYLLETVTTTGGNRSVQHYYYSLHDYTPTAIKNVTTSTGDDAYYDLQGRRIAKPSAHGIYVVNGRKVVK